MLYSFPNSIDRDYSNFVIDNSGNFLFVGINYDSTSTLESYRIDKNNGSLSHNPGSPYDLGGTTTNVTKLAINPASTHLYAISITTDSIYSYAIDQDTGTLSYKNSLGLKVNPDSIAVDPTGKYIYVSNDDGGGSEYIEIIETDGDNLIHRNSFYFNPISFSIWKMFSVRK